MSRTPGILLKERNYLESGGVADGERDDVDGGMDEK